MSLEGNKIHFIPCEPFEATVWDSTNAKMVKAKINGYHVAIREIATFEMPALLHPISVESGAKHGVIACPAFEPIEEPVLGETQCQKT